MKKKKMIAELRAIHALYSELKKFCWEMTPEEQAAYRSRHQATKLALENMLKAQERMLVAETSARDRLLAACAVAKPGDTVKIRIPPVFQTKPPEPATTEYFDACLPF